MARGKTFGTRVSLIVAPSFFATCRLSRAQCAVAFIPSRAGWRELCRASGLGGV
jgi:hypothetical protein